MKECRSKHVMVRVTPTDAAAITDTAKRRGQTTSAFMEQVVMDYITGAERKRKDLDGKIAKVLDLQRRQAELFVETMSGIVERKVTTKAGVEKLAAKFFAAVDGV